MRVVYVTHNGIGSALVRSQVLPYVRALVADGVRVELVTFERAEPARQTDLPPEGRWHRIRAIGGTGLLVKILDILRGTSLLCSLLLREGGITHARSYVPAAMAWVARLLLRQPYIFDMRGFLPEEYVEGGNWTQRDLRYRALRFAEGRLLRDADAIVVLTHRAAERLRTERRYAAAVGDTPVSVIPCAVDLTRFRPSPRRADRPTVVYAGSVGMWYELDVMLRVFAAARGERPGLRFLIVNVGQHDLVRERATAHGLSAWVDLRQATFDEMPALLAASHVGICLLRRTSSKLGSSPIKVAEYLACGLPVVVNSGQGDTDALVAGHRAGHVMSDYSDQAIASAGHALAALADDAEAARNARSLAEQVYSVDDAAAEYLSVYRRLHGGAV